MKWLVPLWILLGSLPATATVIDVPAGQPTIQEAILVADDGDTILVQPGTYDEGIRFWGKNVLLTSAGGRDVTFIHPTTSSGAVVQYASREDSTSIIEGFTIDGNGQNRGFWVNFSTPIIRDCEIRNGHTYDDGAGIICLNGSSAKILNNIVHHNHAGQSGAAIYADQSAVEIVGNLLHDNDGMRPGIAITSGPSRVAYNQIRDNIGTEALWGAGIWIQGDGHEVFNNTIVSNTIGLASNSGSSSVLNNIVVSSFQAGIYIEGQTVPDFNNVWNNASHNFTGPNGISLDPQFVDTSNHDYTLQAASPCLDAGDPAVRYDDADGTRNDMGRWHFQTIYSLPLADPRSLGSEKRTNVANHTPTFSWTFVDTGVAIQTAFELEVGSDDDWAAAEMWSPGVVASPDTFAVYAGSPLQDGQFYAMRVRVNNGSAWGDWRMLRFRLNSPPSVPVLLAPTSGTRIPLANARVAVQNSSDAQQDGLSYDFEVYLDPGLASLVASDYLVPEQSGVTHSGLLTGLTVDLPYWWRARAHDGVEYSSWSPVDSFTTRAPGAIVDVPGAAPDIQSAILLSADGDTILIAPGTYDENIDLLGRSIVVTSSAGPATTIVRSVQAGVPVVSFVNGEDSTTVLSGLTIDGNTQSQCILSSGSGPIIRNCDVRFAFYYRSGGGITCIDSSTARIRDNLIHDNSVGWIGAGIYADEADVVISGNRIYNNSGQRPGIGLVTGPSRIDHNVIFDNVGTDNKWAAGIWFQGDGHRITNNTLVGNTVGLATNQGVCTVFNNIVAFNTEEGLLNEGSSVVDYNNVWSNGSENDPGPHGIGADPLFMNILADDYRLQPTSPCIDAGHRDYVYNDPDGTRNDIGALYLDLGSNRPLASGLNLGPEILHHVIGQSPVVHWSFEDTATGGSQTAAEVQVGTDNDWAAAEMWNTGTLSTADTSLVYAGNPLVDGTEYLLRARLHNGSVWGDWRFLRFTMNVQPSVPVAIAPVGGVSVTTTNLRLSVELATDSEDDTLTYDFEVYLDSSRTVLAESDYDVAQGLSNTQSKLMSTLPVGTDLYWQSRAYDGYEYSDWSPLQHFRTRTPGGTIDVPAGAPTIQAGIELAELLDTVLVAPGVYPEHIDFLGKGIVVRSSGGRGVTTIQSVQPGVPVVRFATGEDSTSVLSGFAVDGGDQSRGVFCSGSGSIIRDCDIRNARSSDHGGGIACVNYATTRIRDNLIRLNYATNVGAGIFVDYATVEITGNWIFDNDGKRPGIGLTTGPSKIYRNVIFDNTGHEAQWGAGIWFQGDGHEIINNTVVGNTVGLATNQGVSTVINNIVVSNLQQGVVNSSGQAYFDYNDVWNNGSGNISGTNGISADPQFVSAASQDYQLLPASPCIDAGDPAAEHDDPDGSRNDMGALYFDLGSAPPLAENRNLGTEVSDHVVSHTPTLYWTFSDTTTGSSQNAFELQVGTDKDWTLAEMWNPGVVTSADTFVVYAGAPLTDGFEFFFRVRLNNGSDWGDWRQSRFTMNSRPSAPVALSPVGGIPVSLLHIRLLIDHGTDPQSDSLLYDFELYLDSAMTILEDSDLQVAPQDTLVVSKQFAGLIADTMYWWRSRAFDGYESGDWSPSESFLARPPGVIDVPGTLPTIQAAIDLAWDGDTVLVAPGTYQEHIDFLGKAVLVRADQGRDTTVIEATTPGVAVVIFASGEDSLSVLDGFTVRDAVNASGIVCSSSSPVVQYCAITNHQGAEWGGGVMADGGSAPSIRHNLIHGNQGEYGAAIGVRVGGQPEIAFNTIHSNTGKRPGIAIEGGVAQVHHNVIRHNTGGQARYGAGIWFQGSGHQITDNTLVGNTVGLSTNSGQSTVTNNIVAWNTDEGIYAVGTLLFDYNDVWNNGTNDRLGVHSISVYPEFNDVPGHDYSLHLMSPCIDAGDPAHPLDPDGTRSDMGAFYHDQGSDLPLAVDRSLGAELPDHVLNHTPTVFWSFQDTATGSTQTAYEIEVGTENEWTVAEMWATGAVASSDTSVVYAGLPLVDGEEYVLRVRLNNGSGWGSWRFVRWTMNLQPSTPIVLRPTGGLLVPLTNVRLEVGNSSDSSYDTLTYDFELFSDPLLTTLEASDYDVAEQSLETSSGLIGGLSADSMYWWRARAWDGYEYSGWTPADSLRTRQPGGTIVVPDEVATIQAAIDLAVSSDTVKVRPGTYAENIDFLGKAIVVVSTLGRDVTRIESDAAGQPVVRFATGEDSVSVIDGFEISWSSGAPGILCTGTGPIIRNCEIHSCVTSGRGGGIGCTNGSTARIRNNVFHHNHASIGAAIDLDNSFVEVTHNILHSNSGERPGIGLANGRCTIEYNVIRDNVGTDVRWGAGIWFQGNGHRIINNTLVGNTIGLSTNSGISTVINNIVTSSTSHGIYPAGASGIDYNNAWNNGLSNDPGPNGISDDPRFTDTTSNDYTLLGTSPCIDAGHPDLSYDDRDGTRNDLGALYLDQGSAYPLAEARNLGFEVRHHVVNHAPTIYWSYTDTASGSTQSAYELDVGTDNQWTIAEMWSTGSVSSGDTAVVYAGAPLVDGTEYLIRIRVSNGAWGDWRFLRFIMNTDPTVPVALVPVPGAIVPAANVRLAVTNSIDGDGDSLTYDFQVYSDSTLVTLEESDYSVAEQTGSTWSKLLSGLADNAPFWWRSRVFDGYEFSAWMPTGDFSTRGAGGTIVVPGDAPTIQTAIDIAVSGDTILVLPGTYIENIDFIGKGVALLSSKGRDSTTIESVTAGVPVVTFTTGEDSLSVLDGFTIEGQHGASGIICYATGPIIRNCEICGNSGVPWGGAIAANAGASPIIRYNLIHDNQADLGAAIGLRVGTNTEIAYNEIYSNTGLRPGIAVEGSVASIHHNVMYDNIGSQGLYGAAIWFQGDGHTIHNNTIVDNTRGISTNGGAGTITNNIVVSNSLEGIYHVGQSQIDYCDVWANGSFNDAGLNGISADPLFNDPNSRDYSLQDISPCIDRGDPASPLDPDGSRADIGALYGTLVGFLRGDANNDGNVVASDIIYLVSYVFKAGPPPVPVWQSGDADCDDGVTVTDVIYLVNYVFKAGPAPGDACP